MAVHGQSFVERAVVENLVPAYPDPVPGAFNVGVLHTALEGMSGHARYAPCSLAELAAKGYDYWALGHVHQRHVLHERPHVVFPGNLQGRHVRETGPKGACLVTVCAHEVAAVELIALDVVRWSRVQVPVEDARSLANVSERMRAAIESAVTAEADGRLLVMRLVLDGRTDLHARLAASDEALLAQAQASSLALGEGIAWVEKVEVETRPASTTSPAASIPALNQILAEACTDQDLLSRLEADLGELSRRSPHELRDGTDDPFLTAALHGDYSALAAGLSPFLTAHLDA